MCDTSDFRVNKRTTLDKTNEAAVAPIGTDNDVVIQCQDRFPIIERRETYVHQTVGFVASLLRTKVPGISEGNLKIAVY